MRDDPQLIKQIIKGSIVQVIPGDDHGHGIKLFVVEQVESWGVKAYHFEHEKTQKAVHTAFTWNMIEPTGGQAVFDTDGRRAENAPAVAVRPHHP